MPRRLLLTMLAVCGLGALGAGPANASQQFACQPLFGVLPGGQAAGMRVVTADNAQTASCAAFPEVPGCRAVCTPHQAPAASTWTCDPAAPSTGALRCLVYVCVTKDRGWGSDAAYRITARTPQDMRHARKRPGDAADTGYVCMADAEYESQRRQHGWPAAAPVGPAR